MSAKAVIGVWARGQPPKVQVIRHANDAKRRVRAVGPGLAARQPAVQRGDRPVGKKDDWNATAAGRRQGLRRSTSSTRSWPGCCRCSTRACSRTSRPQRRRAADLVAILLTGCRPASSPASRTTPGRRYADMLRLNVAIPPTASPNTLGLLGGDLAGFPNGRRVADDIVTIELRAIAGATYPLVDPSYTPDAAAARGQPTSLDAGTGRYLATFPYLGTPHDGFNTPSLVAGRLSGARRPPSRRAHPSRRSHARALLAPPAPRGASCSTSAGSSARWSSTPTRALHGPRSRSARGRRRRPSHKDVLNAAVGQPALRRRVRQVAGRHLHALGQTRCHPRVRDRRRRRHRARLARRGLGPGCLTRRSATPARGIRAPRFARGYTAEWRRAGGGPQRSSVSLHVVGWGALRCSTPPATRPLVGLG